MSGAGPDAGLGDGRPPPVPHGRLVHHPTTSGREEAYVAEAIASGRLAGDGPFTRRCEELLERELGAPRVLLTTSCTHALEMSAHLLDIEPGDEVILPSFTFVSCVNAVVLRGARPVFVDIRPDTLNLDEARLERLIGPRTKAILPVHYAGVGCEMDRIGELASASGVAVVEDAAHGLFARYRAKPLGTFGALATLSFHETKNFTCGEGGALIVNDSSNAARAEILREKGTNRKAFFRGEVDKYSWVDVGSSYVLSDVLAAFLLGQLERREEVQAPRRAFWEAYHERLGGWAEANGVRLPVVPEHCDQAYHLFYVLMPSLEARRALIRHLRDAGIESAFHYVPLHLAPMGRRFGYSPGDLPVTEDLADRLLRLPFHNAMTPGDHEKVCTALLRFEVGKPAAEAGGR
jgi:dTDP-4-amino-4,6-dideoxygalactose transaminase